MLLLEELELQDEIVGVLTSEHGIELVPAGGTGAVTVDAGGDTLTWNAVACNRFAAFDGLRGVLEG